jgi:hypothetical protein
MFWRLDVMSVFWWNLLSWTQSVELVPISRHTWSLVSKMLCVLNKNRTVDVVQKHNSCNEGLVSKYINNLKLCFVRFNPRRGIANFAEQSFHIHRHARWLPSWTIPINPCVKCVNKCSIMEFCWKKEKQCLNYVMEWLVWFSHDGDWAMGWDTEVWFHARVKDKFLHSIQISSMALKAFYQMDSRGCFTGGKLAGVWSWPLTSI